ncbi:MAG: hypothetical protein WC901_04865 [Candidatus Margulisiibacteriota bacterium]
MPADKQGKKEGAAMLVNSLNAAGVTPKPNFLLPITYDGRDDDEKALQGKREKQKETGVVVTFSPLIPSAGCFYYNKEAPIGDQGTKIEFPMVYLKIASQLDFEVGRHKLTLTEDYKVGYPISATVNPDGNVYAGVNELSLAYGAKFRLGGSAMSVGALVEHQAKPTGDTFIRPMGTLALPYTRTFIGAGFLQHLTPDEGKTLQAGGGFTWMVIQPVASFKSGRYAVTLSGFSDGEYNPGTNENNSLSWVYNGGVIKATY